MGSGSSLPQDKHIVVIGGGYGGVTLSMQLLKMNANFTLVDAKDSFHHNVASVRAVALPGFAKKMVVPYEPTFGKHFTRGKVTSIETEKKVIVLENGATVSYDVLVIATGSFGPMKESSGTAAEIIEKYSRITGEVEKSQNVLIIGGGPVGIETAGEVATIYKDKSVTVIHGGTNLIAENVPKPFLEKLMSIVDQLHIKLILGENAENFSELPDGVHGSYQVKTSGGKTIDANIILKCTGLKINNTAYCSSDLRGHLDDSGALKVNEFFQVEGFTDIFAFGDCCNMKEARLAFIAKLQAGVVATNITKFLTGCPLQPWKPEDWYTYKIYMALSMGSQHGVLGLKDGWVLPECIAVNLKSKDMMTGSAFKDMNQTVPQ